MRPWATAERTLALWCADWPLVAAGVSPDEPAVVLRAGRTVACTPAARAEGVRRGMRRRDAEARCPHLAVLDHDPARDARAFEPVAAAVEAFAPRVELTRPGLCAVATRGPSRYFGGDEPLAAQVVAAVSDVLGAAAAHIGVGVADGAFAATLAAQATGAGARAAPLSGEHGARAAPQSGERRARAAPLSGERRARAAPQSGEHGARAAPQSGEHGASVLVLAEGGTPSFLADLPVSALAGADDGSLVDLARLLVRLGLRTLGAVAALPEADLVARFGVDGGLAWRRSQGLDDRPLEARDPPPDLAAEVVLDPPADRIDAAAFAARTLAADLHDRLEARGLACTRLTIEAVTTEGERLSRVWRHEGRFTPGATAERVRWQLDGWLAAGARAARQRAQADARASRQSGAVGAGQGRAGGVGQSRVEQSRAGGVGLGRKGGVGQSETGGVGQSRAGGVWLRGAGGAGLCRDDGGGGAPQDSTPGDVGGRAEGGGLVLLRLVPEEVVAGGGRQLGFWGGDAEADERASRALARVQGLLGPAAVVTAVASGGRGPRLRATLVPWGDPREPARPGGGERAAIELGPVPTEGGRACFGTADRPEVVERRVARPRRTMGPAAGEVPPWPGRVPGPPPAVVPVERAPAQVVDAAGAPVTVSGRGLISAAPARVAWPHRTVEVAGWAGPWPVEERWWDPAASRLARIQVTAADGTALLLACQSGSWWLEASYD